ncbi:MAG: DNA-binding protein [Eubacteriales bacterium]
MKQQQNNIETQALPAQFISSKEVAQLLQISQSHSYRLVREMNKELEAKGFMTIAGRVSRRYFSEKFYGFEEVAQVTS